MSGLVTASANRMFDEILEHICVGLQITPTQFKSVEQKYKAVGDLLSEDGSPVAKYSPHIFPQGSLNLDTTVKPFGQNEFDLDLVCKLSIYGPTDPARIYEMVWDRMYGHKTYRAIIERKRRCIRVNYAGDFHLDIVPAVPDCDGADEDCILIPDIPKPHLKDWKPSNPVGYARWFELRTIKTIKMAEARVDPLRQPRPAHLKPTLKRSVQLLKRWRDIHFADEMDLAPPSIILTTLAAQLHKGEEWCTDALATILTGIWQITRRGKPKLYNPVNPDELISERWEDDEASYDAFVEAIREYRERWLDLVHSRGVPEISKELKVLFGEPAVQAFKEITKPVSQARVGNGLYVTKDSRMLTETKSPSTYRVESNYFYGD